MTDTQTPINWLDEEIKNNATPSENFEKLEPLKLEVGKIVKFTVDFSKPFNKWTDPTNKTIKAIIPVTHKTIRKNLWLNVKNPLYNQICTAGKTGQVDFAVSTAGTQKDTKYTIVTED